jgi:PAS domain S-box-containing protein
MLTPDRAMGENEQDFGALFDCFPEMLAVLSAEGDFCWANAALQDAIAPRSGSLVGWSLFTFIHPDDLQVASQKLERTLQVGDKVSFRSRCGGGDRRSRWIHWSLRRTPNVRQVYAVARDVTDHYTAEQELARVNDILSTVLLSAPLPIWASDPDGRIQFWNESAERVLGWTSEELLNGTPPDTLPRYSAAPGARLTGEKMSWRRKDGSVRELRFWTAPLRENGLECGTLGMTVDVTEYDAELYRALQEAYKDLRDTRDVVMQHERLRVLGQMASGIAHDINNALSPVKLYTKALLDDESGLTERGRKNLRTIRNAIDDVVETVARMREFYRLREPQITLAPVTLNDLVQEVVDLTRARWRDIPQRVGITIQMATELEENLPPIWGIESEIRAAVTNLVFNAVDAMPEGGTLTLRTLVAKAEHPNGEAAELRHVFLDVEDTGSGMDEETRRRCLEPFFTTKGERGSGLGLAMVYGAVQRNHAAIEIESSLGSGTRIRLRFEVAASTADRQPAQPAPRQVTPSSLRILVIDDDPLVAEVLRDTLERDGHQVTTAEGGETGIRAFREAQDRGEGFALVLTDLGMPDVDGRRVASTVKGDSPSTPVILLTGWGRRLVEEGDIPPHVDQVLSKPPDPSELRAAVASCSSAEV